MAIHERVWENDAGGPVPQRPGVMQVREWRPVATYSLLGIIAGMYLLQLSGLSPYYWVAGSDWMARPWSPFVSTFAHLSIGHLFLNGIVLYFFGPIAERLLGRRDFVVLFVLSGALASIMQGEFSAAWGDGRGGAGASGALMWVFGTLVVLMPREKILLFAIVPVPFWGAALGFALLDIFGVLSGASGIGHVAHLSGMVLGLALGFGLRRNPRLHFGPPRAAAG